MKTQKFRNKSLGLKTVSLLIAVMLWFYVANQGGAATSQNVSQVKLNYYNVPAGLNVVGPENVAVKIWGSTKESGNIIAYVDLTGMQQGDYKVSVKVKPLQGVMLATVQPDKVDIQLAEPAERSLPIRYELSQSLPEGAELREVNISPGKCIIKGEQSAIKQVAAVYVRISVGSERGIFSTQSELVAKDAQGNSIVKGIALIPQTVKIYGVVENKKESKDLAVKIKTKGTPADGFELGTISSDPAVVSALGEQRQLDNLAEIASQEIDLSGKKERFTQVVPLQAPEGLIISPTQVNVVVNIDPVTNGGNQ